MKKTCWILMAFLLVYLIAVPTTEAWQYAEDAVTTVIKFEKGDNAWNVCKDLSEKGLLPGMTILKCKDAFLKHAYGAANEDAEKAAHYIQIGAELNFPLISPEKLAKRVVALLEIENAGLRTEVGRLKKQVAGANKEIGALTKAKENTDSMFGFAESQLAALKLELETAEKNLKKVVPELEATKAKLAKKTQLIWILLAMLATAIVVAFISLFVWWRGKTKIKDVEFMLENFRKENKDLRMWKPGNVSEFILEDTGETFKFRTVGSGVKGTENTPYALLKCLYPECNADPVDSFPRTNRNQHMRKHSKKNSAKNNGGGDPKTSNVITEETNSD